MSNLIIEYTKGQLSNGDATREVTLRLRVRELFANESSTPVARAVAQHYLETSVPDGRYTLTYHFEGREETHSVRVQGGVMLAG